MRTLKTLWEELEKEGCREKDIRVALKVTKAISCVDKLIFPDEERGFIRIIASGKHHHGFPVVYDGKDDRYLIFVEDIAKYIKKEKKDRFFLIKNSRQEKKHKLSRMTWKQMFMRIAVHEVRHRIQTRIGLEMIDRSNLEEIGDPILKQTAEFYAMAFDRRKDSYLEEGVPENFIKSRMNPEEFDASVIESYIMSKIWLMGSLASLASLMKTEGPKRE